jgi:hypothetical protein
MLHGCLQSMPLDLSIRLKLTVIPIKHVTLPTPAPLVNINVSHLEIDDGTNFCGFDLVLTYPFFVIHEVQVIWN